MKIIINNVVPLNRGDECLVFTLISFLKEHIPDAQIEVYSKSSSLNNKYNSFPFIIYKKDIEQFWKADKRKLLQKPWLIFKYLALIIDKKYYLKKGQWLMEREERTALKNFMTSDFIISNPGSYIIDYYNYESRMTVFHYFLEKKVAIGFFLHSFGPFWIKKRQRRNDWVFNRVHHISVRENISKLIMEEQFGMKIDDVGTDLAFSALSFVENITIPNKNGPIEKVVVCFRNWPQLDEVTLNTGVAITKYLINQYRCEVTFLSTCQGISGYVDDSEMSMNIYQHLDNEEREKVTVDREEHSFVQLIHLYSKYDAFIGMRLHGAIFSMLGNTIPLVLSVEHKVKGIFENLGLHECEVPVTDKTEIFKRIDLIMKNSALLRTRVQSACEIAKQMNKESINQLIRDINESADLRKNNISNN